MRDPKVTEAVARGIKWLDVKIPGWRDKINPESLNLRYPCDCVLGQIDDDFYASVWKHRLTRAQVFRFGFHAPKGMSFRALTMAWRRALAGSR